MIRYRYTSEFQPSAPFVNATIRCPTTRRQTVLLPAQLDCGCDRTILPAAVVEELQLVQVGQFACVAFESEVMNKPLYLAEVILHDFPAIEVQVTLGKKEPFILLGRDVLNHFRIVLDGPQLTLEIG